MILPADLCASAAAGSHNFLGLVADVVREAGFEVAYVPRGSVATLSESRSDGYTLFHMEPPLAARSVTVRLAYAYPFWAIETTADRWDWTVAKAAFPDGSRHPDTNRFFRHWQRRLFDNAPGKTTRDGIVFVPLQGRIRIRRRFQTCSPMDMLKTVLEQDQRRRVIATLHPSETYDRADLAALDRLADRHDRFRWQEGGSVELLRICDFVATQNSSLGFFAGLFEKPSLLFARSDFHHVAIDVAKTGVTEAFERIADHRPDFAGYLHWYWQKMSINAGRPEAKDAIRAKLRAASWPL